MRKKNASTEKTKVQVVICPSCRHGIYSVADYDFHYCPCNLTFVDGGFSYLRYGGGDGENRIRVVELELPYAKAEMRADYYGYTFFSTIGRDFGTLTWDEIRKLYTKTTKKAIRLVAAKSRSTKKSANEKSR